MKLLSSWVLGFQGLCVFGAMTECNIDSIQQFVAGPGTATVTSAQALQQNSTFGGGAADLEFPVNDTDLPALCAVTVNVKSSNTSSYNFGLFLPQQWNNRFIATGNGAYAGGINWNDMGTNARYGFASMSTDTGHVSGSFDASWALNNPEAQFDWGYRSMHGSVIYSKLITSTYYGTNISYSYYSGCSTGGRQGFRDIELYPEDFDGILAGAPAWWTTHLQPDNVQVALHNLPVDAPTHIPSSLFPVIGAEVLRQCDPQDGFTDGIISDPEGCNFVPERLLCTPTSNKSACLTGPQLDTLYHIYNDWWETNQTFVFPHYELGSEAQYGFLLNTDSGTPTEPGIAWIQNCLYNDTTWDWHDFTYQVILDADRINPGQANVGFDFTGFYQRGGKIIQYHGLADGLIPTPSSELLYKNIWRTMGAAGIPLDNWYRLFLVPGMEHCQGTAVNAPYYIASAGQPFALGQDVWSVPGYSDPKHDALLALLEWRENGTAPESIIGTKFINETVTAGVQRQRPICMYPMQAKYSGNGDPDLPESWHCQLLY
ncbi:uncharacterized protein Z520_11991 [Fonsecaea multimorphosa CBS 102226]|uniref:Carboxylic ester hydrolase n=1 Tax=Fonsecaea multimorphosa CBS 102226 TaxID=1442371 RepID=A0A0D2GRU5_9EURO|nr:uncharacterized protein Z520_11991 [Fonsecaea multimorphosa CBS 102226]KIX92245.1 hypothetical protein Z520_11991 [Fonsecaea multimorphosa CBS 102226]OAL17621.1 hypothetical protein AYO22_11411 [Fonsecaea multimorphosa]